MLSLRVMEEMLNAGLPGPMTCAVRGYHDHLEKAKRIHVATISNMMTHHSTNSTPPVHDLGVDE